MARLRLTKIASMTSTLDRIAGELEKIDPKLALALDRVSDSIDPDINKEYPESQHGPRTLEELNERIDKKKIIDGLKKINSKINDGNIKSIEVYKSKSMNPNDITIRIEFKDKVAFSLKDDKVIAMVASIFIDFPREEIIPSIIKNGSSFFNTLDGYIERLKLFTVRSDLKEMVMSIASDINDNHSLDKKIKDILIGLSLDYKNKANLSKEDVLTFIDYIKKFI